MLINDVLKINSNMEALILQSQPKRVEGHARISTFSGLEFIEESLLKTLLLNL